MAMRISRYSAERIAQYGRSRATLDATVLRHRASIRPVSPQRMPWSSILAKKSSCGVLKMLFEASVQKARNGPSTHVIEATSCVENWNATIMAKSTANVLAIKRYQWTKIVEVTNPQRSL